MHVTEEACLCFTCGIDEAQLINSLRASMRHMSSIQRCARSTAVTVHYAEYQSLAQRLKKILSAARKLTGFEQHSPRAFERSAMCPVKLADEEFVFPLVRPSCEISGSDGLDRTDYPVQYRAKNHVCPVVLYVFCT
jgi:hypothetical protein